MCGFSTYETSQATCIIKLLKKTSVILRAVAESNTGQYRVYTLGIVVRIKLSLLKTSLLKHLDPCMGTPTGSVFDMVT